MKKVKRFRLLPIIALLALCYPTFILSAACIRIFQNPSIYSSLTHQQAIALIFLLWLGLSLVGLCILEGDIET